MNIPGMDRMWNMEEVRQETLENSMNLPETKSFNSQLMALMSKFDLNIENLSEIGSLDDNFNTGKIIQELDSIKKEIKRSRKIVVDLKQYADKYPLTPCINSKIIIIIKNYFLIIINTRILYLI